MTREELERAGRIFAGADGAGWQTALAHAAGVADRTVRRWIAGERPAPPGLRSDLARAARARGEALMQFAEELEKRDGPD